MVFFLDFFGGVDLISRGHPTTTLGLISISVFFANKKKSIATQAPRHTSAIDVEIGAIFHE